MPEVLNISMSAGLYYSAIDKSYNKVKFRSKQETLQQPGVTRYYISTSHFLQDLTN